MTAIISWALNIIIVTGIIVFIWVVGPWAETRWFPVYSTFKLVKIEPRIGGSTVTIQGVKLRDCVPQGYAWYAGDFGNNERELGVRSKRGNTAPSLKPGRFEAQFEIDITPMEIMAGITAETLSRCHPFWLTRTAVYP